MPDLILVIGTSGVRAGTLGQVRVLSPQTVMYCLYPDSPHNLDQHRIACLPFFDRVTTSSPAWVDAFRQLGGRRVEYLPFAADTTFHRPAASSGREYDADVTFIGSWRPEREDFLEKLCRGGALSMTIWGNSYWRSKTRPASPLRRCWTGRPAVGAEFAKVCAESAILLNMLDPVTWPGPNMRTFELAACGAFQLAARSPAVLEIFSEGETIECFGSAEEAGAKILRYKHNEAARSKVATAGHELVIRGGHTYLDRVSRLLEWFISDKSTK